MFKVGDKVVIVNTDYFSEELANGQTGVVTRIDNAVIGVIMDNGYVPSLIFPDDLDSWNFYKAQLELSE